MSDYYLQNDTEGGPVLPDADEMIRANGEAEAQETTQLKNTAAMYSRQIEELKALCEKNSALVAQLQKENETTTRNIGDVLSQAVTSMEQASDEISKAARMTQEVDLSGVEQQIKDSSYDAGKKAADAVYAAQDKITAAISDSQAKTADLIQQSDDFSHKENVRVYRNIQAATDQLLRKQTDDILKSLPQPGQGERPKANGVEIASLVVLILLFIYVACDSLGVIAALQTLLNL